MGLLNPSFEVAGALPGEAQHWVLVSVTSLESIAGFGAAPERACEDFEGWLSFWGALADVAVVRAFFDVAAEGYEDFAEGWATDLYLLELPPAQLAQASFGPGDVEACEVGWANSLFATEWSAVVGAVAVFDGESREDFEDQWSSNHLYGWTWTSVASATAMFDAGAQAREDFENDWALATTL
jgi:hypothetical protein